ncbi:DUF169 domain-containing protein [Amycolatopsis sp. WAC 01376]|uniref:DUF169 domain-containing protein n=1 Tax=Amycolatopsis sp. WAC 01376 TaxID=2203195 RepID=UPI0018F3D46C|nr:DUF169 domain-containing protein [Amycolatopsis sp. WAC 01376]
MIVFRHHQMTSERRTMEHAHAAARITDLLSTDLPPVALTFTDGPPEGVAVSTEAVPSSCNLWRVAEKGVFYAAAEQHFNCPVGAMVMGFELPAATGEVLGGLVQSMCDARYLDPDEAANIPSVEKKSAGIVYGPLAEFPIEPDLILLWLTPAQAMIYNEAAGNAKWTASPMDVSGRPGCAALPLALKSQTPRMALGCIGMRTFTDIADDRILAVLPGGLAEEFVSALETTVAANAEMKKFYETAKAGFV